MGFTKHTMAKRTQERIDKEVRRRKLVKNSTKEQRYVYSEDDSPCLADQNLDRPSNVNTAIDSSK